MLARPSMEARGHTGYLLFARAATEALDADAELADEAVSDGEEAEELDQE